MVVVGIVIIIGLAVAFVYLVRKRRRKAIDDDDNKEKKGNTATETIVDRLEQLGYFKYSDPENVLRLKDDLAESITRLGMLSTIFDQKTLIPLDYRYYLFDGERMVEKEGFKKTFKGMQPFFDIIMLQIAFSNYVEREGNHQFTLNSKEYIVFQNFEGSGWREAAQRFAEILNDQLALQEKEERLYLINHSNDGSAVFLTDEQFKLIESTIRDKRWKPLNVDDWCRTFQVDPKKYLGIPL